MATIPLPALHTAPIEQPPNQIQMMAQLMGMKNAQQEMAQRQAMAPLEQQQAQQTVQTGQIEQQQKQMELQSTKALMGAFASQDPADPNYFDNGIKAAQATGQVIPQHMQGLLNTALEFKRNAATLTKTQLDTSQSVGDSLHALGTQALQLPDQDLQAAWPTIRQKVVSLEGMDATKASDQVPTQFPGRDWIQFHTVIAGMSAAGARAASAQQQADTEQQKVQATMNPQSTLYAPSPASVAMGTAPGSAQIQAGEVKQAAAKAGAEESARMPGEMALAAQKQALSEGDPKAAAQLLVNGDATLAELKARGATPGFIAHTLHAAHVLSNGQYNAQQADAQFDVAKSPTNVAFFGSAKSLTDKGGTLDQLEAAGKAIPGGQLPVFNNIADWEKAATGSGPIAKYASLALGVADDYSKVMGGGQGSDTSRLQALKLIAAGQSPEQRSASVEGIRGAVGSQMNSRIGQNPVLQRMYGGSVAAPNANSGPTPQTHTFSLGAWQATHPGGDANAAKAAAQQQGYQVVQ